MRERRRSGFRLAPVRLYRWTSTGILECVGTLDRLASEDDRGDAATAVRGHHDKVATFRLRGIDDRLIWMLMLDVDCSHGRLALALRERRRQEFYRHALACVLGTERVYLPASGDWS